MTKLLEKAIEKARELPAEEQDALADMLLFLTDPNPYRATEEERAGIERGLADARASRFASPHDIASLFSAPERA